MISFNSPLNWEEEEGEIGKQTGNLPWSLLIPRAYECYIAVLVAAKMLQSNVIVSSQGASFLLSQRQFYICFLLNLYQNILEVYW